ncbi:MAG: hypothetical protein P8185_12915 [Deltaproteobacteria bacterium]
MSTVLAGLWFAACKTTPAPSTPLPPQPETSETKDARRSTSPPSAESAEPGARETSQTSQATSPEAAATQKPKSKENSQNRQTTSAGAKETRPQEAAQGVPQGPKTATQTADAKLAKARDDLRVSQATEKRIADQLEALKKSGNASDEDIRNYEAYLERVQAMVAENRRMVAKMESAYARHPSGKENSSEPPKVPDHQIPEEQVSDQVSELDRQLSASLSEFDSLLLKEMETIESESTAKMHDLAQEAADAARRLKEKGVELESAESESADETSVQGKAEGKDATRTEKGTEKKQGDGDDKVASTDTSKGEGSGPTGDRGSRYSKEDDDIVARQLREAAENETDPELKEKLWKEYEEYKKNTQP